MNVFTFAHVGWRNNVDERMLHTFKESSVRRISTFSRISGVLVLVVIECIVVSDQHLLLKYSLVSETIS